MKLIVESCFLGELWYNLAFNPNLFLLQFLYLHLCKSSIVVASVNGCGSPEILVKCKIILQYECFLESIAVLSK